MSRYRGPRLRLVRRLGVLPGLTSKVSKKVNPPGQHGSSLSKKSSQFKVRLKEKQKLRYHYGITERQLLNYMIKARSRKGSSGRLLLSFLEMRLDNIVFRLGFAPTVPSARQLVTHNHILVNSNLINIPSYICSPQDLVTVRNNLISQSLVKSNIDKFDNFILPQHLVLNKDVLEGKIISFVNRKSISLVINELLVVEYYSRKV